MKINIYSVYDANAGYFNPPFASRCENEVILGFKQAVTTGQNKIWQQFPEDYCVVRLGTYDDEVGMLIPNKGPEIVVSANSFFTFNTNDTTSDDSSSTDTTSDSEEDIGHA